MQRPLLEGSEDSEVKEVKLGLPVEVLSSCHKCPFLQDKKEAQDEKTPAVGCCALFRFATGFDIFLMIVGVLNSAASGAVFPLFSVVFGQLIDKGFSGGISKSPVLHHPP